MATTTNGIATISEAATLGGLSSMPSGYNSTQCIINNSTWLTDCNVAIVAFPTTTYTSNQAIKFVDLEAIVN